MYGRLFRLVNSEGIAAPALIMLIASVAGGGCNFLYNLFMANNIPELAELNALLAMLTIVTVPALGVQNVLIRYTSRFKALGQDDAISWLVRRLLVMTVMGGVILSLVLLVFLNIPQISSGLKLTNGVAIMVLSATILVTVIGPVGMGPLQGLERFIHFGLQNMGTYALRLVMGVSLVMLGFGLSGAIGGVLIGAAFGTGYSLFAIRKYLLSPGRAVASGEIWWFTLPALSGVLFYTVLTNVDVILAQVLLDTTSANYYAAASSLAKIILFIPGSVSSVMFPKVAKVHVENGKTNRLLNSAFVMAFLLSVAVVAVYALLPNIVLPLLLPSWTSYHALITPVLQELAPAMMFLGLANLFMLYGLATDGHAYIVTMGLTILALGVFIAGAIMSGAVFTATLLSTIMAATGILGLVLSGIYLIIVEREWRPRSSGR